MSVRVRFAPSPTGFLHIGGARTALFNWLYARHTGGAFILRIEDTDAARNTQEATEVILSGLRWLGLNWDEGPAGGDPAGASLGDYGPYFQSQRADIYRRRVQELRDKGLAYDADGAVKFKMDRRPVLIPDLVVGNVLRELTDREAADPDFVIVRSDGQPVFHLVNVVDDLEMKITHVIRGEDHLSNTAKHIALFRAFGVEPPHYAHIPLILNPDGAKMSKRDAGASLRSYIEDGSVPEAVLNYLCLLGWSPKHNREKMAVEETIQLFDLPQILRHNARFDLNKLRWLDAEYIRDMGEDRFRELSLAALARAGLPVNNYPAEYARAALATCREKSSDSPTSPLTPAFISPRKCAWIRPPPRRNSLPTTRSACGNLPPPCPTCPNSTPPPSSKPSSPWPPNSPSNPAFWSIPSVWPAPAAPPAQASIISWKSSAASGSSNASPLMPDTSVIYIFDHSCSAIFI